jgi:glycosyltransferase involved in cell wall biosynthesis
MRRPGQVLRLAACATHPIQYQAPVWRVLAADPGIELHVFFGTDMSLRGYHDPEFGAHVAWDSPLTAGYAHTFLSGGAQLQKVGKWSPGADGLRQRLREFKPDVALLTAYGSRFQMGALLAAKRVGARVIMRHEASDVAVSRTRFKGWLRDRFLRWLYARVDGFAVIGIEAGRHLERLGVARPRMVPAPYCVDSDFFAGEAARWCPNRKAIRAELGIGEGQVALVFSGKLIPKKDPLLIVEALRCVAPEFRNRLHLLVAGDGELRRELEEAAGEAFAGRFRFFGFLNQSEIGRVYAAGDLLILPSRRGAGETWGLVVNEAMQFGLGIVASDGVGCWPDLVNRGTGRVFPAGDPAAAGAAIRECVEAIDRDPRGFSTTSRERVARFNPFSAAAGIAGIAGSTLRS